MMGKVLKISANDINGNVDDRRVVVFCAFVHTKYMNNYVIFAFEGEYGKKKLCFGSVHLKQDSLVIFSVKDEIRTYIEEFLNEYENDKVENFKLLDIRNVSKVDLISYNEMDYDKLEMLDNKSIEKEAIVLEEEKKTDMKTTVLYILLVLLILLAIGISLVYFYPDKFLVGNKSLSCTNRLYDKKLGLYYDVVRDIKFNDNDKLESISVELIYTFLDSNEYYEFKDNEKHLNYFKYNGSYKYIDDGLKLRIVYQDSSVVDDYEEMVSYLDKEGYSCAEGEYE